MPNLMRAFAAPGSGGLRSLDGSWSGDPTSGAGRTLCAPAAIASAVNGRRPLGGGSRRSADVSYCAATPSQDAGGE
jgi:hypothetical protein